MNQPAFILDFSPNEVSAITAARSLADDLAASVPITRKLLSETFTKLTYDAQTRKVVCGPPRLTSPHHQDHKQVVFTTC